MSNEEIVAEPPKPFTSPRRKKNKELLQSGGEHSKHKSKPKNSDEATRTSSKNNEDTSKSSNRPQLKIVRNNLGSLVIAFFGILGDVYLFAYSTYYTYKFGLLKDHTFMGPERNILFASFVAFVTSIFSIIFSFAILCVSSLSMQKQKRLKLCPYIVFAVFKLILHFWKGLYLICLGFLVKDILLYACMSHTAKNQIVRKFFKPYKQNVPEMLRNMSSSELVLVLIGAMAILLRIYNAAHLSHVVMPFHQRQIESVLKNIRAWSRYPPCKGDFNVGLIFFVSGNFDESLRSELLKSVVSACFNFISVEFAGLEGHDDDYLKGSRLMFEQMIAKNLNFGTKKSSHVFYMEPDCLPIRPFWLNAINELIVPPNAPFWMKGSIFRGHVQTVTSKFIYNHVHINGNAIYNLEDSEFSDFYFKMVSPFVTAKYSQRSRAYDTDIFKLLFWDNSRHTTEFFHKFQFSDFIQNHWHSEYSLGEILEKCPDTFLIHGGHARE